MNSLPEKFKLKKYLFAVLKLLHFWFPVALGWSIAQVVQRATGLPPYSNGLILFLAGIWAAYSLDRLTDDSTRQSKFLKISLIGGLIISIILCAFSAAHLSWKTLSAVVVFSFFSLLYRRLKKYPLLKTFIVAMVWVWAGVALSVVNDQWFVWNWWTMSAAIPLFLLIAAGCILCDLKDLEADKKQNVRSFPVVFGVARTILFVTILASIAAVIAFSQHRPGLFVSSLALIFFSQYPSILSTEDLGPLLVDLILTLPGILIAAKIV